MPENDYLPFATAAGANVLDQSDYAALPAVASGFVQGVAESIQVNKVLRQGAFGTAMLAAFISETLNAAVLDDGDLAGFVAQFQAALAAIQPRLPLTAATTLYVSTTGSDTTGNGSQTNPFATIQAAYNHAISTFDFAGQSLTIQLADGVYTAGLAAQGTPIGATALVPVTLAGDAAAPGNVAIHCTASDAIYVGSGASVAVQNLQVQSTGTVGGYGLHAAYGGLLTFSNVIFGPCTNGHLYATRGGQIYAAGNYTIAGNSNYHAIASQGFCQLSTGGGTPLNITFSGTPTFANAFVDGALSGIVYAPNNTFSGSFIGPRYTVSTVGCVDTEGGGPNYFPGTLPGTASTTTYGAYN